MLVPLPRQKVIEAVDWEILDHVLENIAQVGATLDVVALGSGDQRAHRNLSLAAAI